MKKLLFIITFIMSLLAPCKAGYIIKGTHTQIKPDNLKNYTLALDVNYEPVVAGAMHTNLAYNDGRNTIVIIYTDPLADGITFPVKVFMSQDERYDIEVKDFHYDRINDEYLLCGARTTANTSRAFVARIDGKLLQMEYIEHPEADIFYSICVPNYQSLDYYLCGKRGNFGFICSVERNFLQLTNICITDHYWECHKIIAIIAKPDNNSILPRFVISGRNPECTRIGYTVVDPNFSSRITYMWAQLSEPASLCVVCNHSTEGDKIVLASSNHGSVYLYSILFNSTPTITEYRYNFSVTVHPKFGLYCIQDINMFATSDIYNPPISVVGYMIPDLSPSTHRAWYGVTGLNVLAPMNNKNYSLQGEGQYEHYKIKYGHLGKIYTGGYFSNGMVMCALFGSPGLNADDCDMNYQSLQPSTNSISWTSFGLSLYPPTQLHNVYTFDRSIKSLTYYYDCTPFKGGDDTPEFAISAPETESEIITYHGRITLKDTPTNTNYQIYTMLGQLVQTGTTSPDISTAQLSKGVYILRLENGKAFKFVK